MKTSKIREQLSYRKYRTYNYVAELPSQEKWLVEHVSGSHDIETLRKPIEFKVLVYLVMMKLNGLMNLV